MSLDRCTIKISPPVRVRPEIIEDQAELQRQSVAFFSKDAASYAFGNNTPKSHQVLLVTGNARLSVRSETKGGDKIYFLREVQVNFPSLLFGHNGMLILSPEVLDESFREYRAMLKPLLFNEADEICLLPNSHSESSWKAVEIAFDLADPDGIYNTILRAATHRSARTAEFRWGKESLRHSGTELSWQVYRKDKQLIAEYPQSTASADRITRIEFSLKGDKIGRYLPRVVSFDDIVHAFKTLFEELRGISPLLRVGNIKSNIIQRIWPICELARLTDRPLRDVVTETLNRAHGGAVKQKKITKLLNEARIVQASIYGFDTQEFLNNNLFLNPVAVSIPELEKAASLIAKRNPVNGVTGTYVARFSPRNELPQYYYEAGKKIYMRFITEAACALERAACIMTDD